MTTNDNHTELEPGDVLYESESGEAYAVVVGIDEAGVTVRRGDTESFVPHALFAPWNDNGLVASKPEAHEHRRTEHPSAVRRGPRTSETADRERREIPEQVR